MPADVAEPERGCLLFNATTQRASQGSTVDQVRSTMAAVESVLTGALEGARVRGDLSAAHSPVERARLKVPD
ncbi:hypothetical protein [Streptomyces sp. 4N124]|uniref:hypothetical protein n=1 Tax=Streptomyces sp. 4N124 TaxID=3457420 RepID=UPI003FD39A82